MNRARRLGRAPTAAAGAAAPSAVDAQKASVVVAAPSLIRLDTVAREPGLAVRAVRTDSAIGVWREVSADSARVELPSRGTYLLAKRDRVACPE
jgi:hypothetical protein